jgi:hypothetical protein
MRVGYIGYKTIYHSPPLSSATSLPISDSPQQAAVLFDGLVFHIIGLAVIHCILQMFPDGAELVFTIKLWHVLSVLAAKSAAVVIAKQRAKAFAYPFYSVITVIAAYQHTAGSFDSISSIWLFCRLSSASAVYMIPVTPGREQLVF